MSLQLPRAHRIARNNYLPRTAAFAFCLLTICLLWSERGGAQGWELLAALLTFAVYPQLAYLHSRFSLNSKRAEMTNLYADCLLLGLWAAQMRFALWPCTGMLLAVCLNSVVHGFTARLWRGLAWFGAGALAWGATTGFEFIPDSGPVSTYSSLIGMVAYVSWVGAMSFRKNRNLVRSQHARLSMEEQLRFVTENAGEMIALLDAQGHFLFASPAYAKHFAADTIMPGASWLLLVFPDDFAEARSLDRKSTRLNSSHT